MAAFLISDVRFGTPMPFRFIEREQRPRSQSTAGIIWCEEAQSLRWKASGHRTLSSLSSSQTWSRHALGIARLSMRQPWKCETRPSVEASSLSMESAFRHRITLQAFRRNAIDLTRRFE